ncbi:rhodanese-like domain-containing protein [Heyndrickxia sp. NPDC080065]|uniref:rhodanese-like domain-containing protein n=1 Tax=Heyndrickxia sp. NPDC080065 TaxID=3390568 RepID=UPI003D08FD36
MENAKHIPKTVIFDMEGKENNNDLPLPKHEEIVVTCTTGNSAMKCASILAEKDYKVTVLAGGLTAWKEYLKD